MFIKERVGIIVTGSLIGIAAIALGIWGNPPNMGICVACFIRDTAGALGFHSAANLRYIRPEIPAFLLGAFICALIRREWPQNRPSVQTQLLRFILAFFVMTGCLVFLGCPLRMALRLGAGDLNALVGLAGFFAGIGLGSHWLRRGFSLERVETVQAAARSPLQWTTSLVMPLAALMLLVFIFIKPKFINFSAEGPGSQHAPVLLAFAVAAVIGFLSHQSGFCISGGVRDIFLLRKGWGFAGYGALILTAGIANLVMGKFNGGFQGQPIAHTETLWNFLGMMLTGYGSALIKGCPLRQLIKAGAGEESAGICVLAFFAAAAASHNWDMAASVKGVPFNGKVAVLIGLGVTTLIAFVLSSNKRSGHASA